MVYNKFIIGIIIRVLVLLITIFFFAYLFHRYNDFLINLNFIVLIFLEVYFLIWYLNRTNKTLTNFFTAVSNSDTMLSFKRENSGKSFDKLYDQLDRINEHIQNVKIDLYNQEAFNKLIIGHVNIGIFVVDHNGAIKLLNDSALNILNLQVLTHIKQLNKIQDGFDEIILSIEPETPRNIKLIINDKMYQLLFRVNLYKRQEEMYRLISFQDIKHELDIKEMESWQKLIRILTHEITNSIGPINSTIDTISGFFVDNRTLGVKPVDKLDQKTVDNAVKGIHIIKDRSVGLLDFVQKFRDLTLIPQPSLSKLLLNDLLSSIKLLFDEELDQQKIMVSIQTIPESLQITADRSMIEQVMINLMKNAIEAGGRSIHFKAKEEEEGKIFIRVTDDGKGIDEETIENIFVPFYTTKSEGSGIGLSLSREIMRLHNGSISVRSTPGKGTVFELVFK